MFCTSCGADLETRSPKFCPQCGASLKTRGASSTSGEPFIAIPPTEPARETILEPWIGSAPDLDVSDTALTASGNDAGCDDRIALEPLFPTPSPSGNESRFDRIVVEPLFPRQAVRNSIHPAIALGIGAVILGAIAGGLWWWASGEESASPPATAAIEPLPQAEPPSSVPENPPAMTPVAETAALAPEPGTEPGEEQVLMSIPPLPANQQGRHNSTELKNFDLTMPAPAPRVPAETTDRSPKPPRAAARGQPETPVRPLTPIEMPPPATTPPVAAARPAQTRRDSPPSWLNRMRWELDNCQNFFCREKVRNQYCTGQWTNLPECKSSSL